jgi:hypothetical protein
MRVTATATKKRVSWSTVSFVLSMTGVCVYFLSSFQVVSCLFLLVCFTVLLVRILHAGVPTRAMYVAS